MNYKTSSTLNKQTVSNYIFDRSKQLQQQQSQQQNYSKSSKSTAQPFQATVSFSSVTPIQTATATATSSTLPQFYFAMKRTEKITDKTTKQYYRDVQYVGLCGCHRISRSNCVTALCVLILLLTYSAMGSILFMTLENETVYHKTIETAVAASKPRSDSMNGDIRARTVDRLWSITEDLNILYKENWTRLAAQEVQLFQDSLLRAIRSPKVHNYDVQHQLRSHKWSYSSAFLYSISLITTIGYGGITVRSQLGRISALLYALFGIPIVLLYLSSMGGVFSRIIQYVFHACGNDEMSSGSRSSSFDSLRLGNSGISTAATSANDAIASQMSSTMSVSGRLNCGTGKNANKSRSNKLSSVELDGNVGGVGATTTSTAAAPSSTSSAAHQSQQLLDYLRSTSTVPISICLMVLVCYMTFGAVLFHRIQNWSVLESFYFCFTSLGTIGFGDIIPQGSVAEYAACAYIIIGLAIVAMCFSLIQTEIVLWLRRCGVKERKSTSTSLLTTKKYPAFDYNGVNQVLLPPPPMPPLSSAPTTTTTSSSTLKRGIDIDDSSLLSSAFTPKS